MLDAHLPWSPTRTIEEFLLARPGSRVLLAEDDPALRQLIASSLRADGNHVLEAEDGDDLADWLSALSIRARGEPPVDLLVSDIRMPGASALEVLHTIRAHGWKTHVVLITAFGDPETHASAYRLGAIAVLDKPFDLDDLRDLVALARVA